MKASAYPQPLLLELARCYVQAALGELLREQAHEQTPMKTTNLDKDPKDAIAIRGVRAGLQRYAAADVF